jgi:hypothetical protein
MSGLAMKERCEGCDTALGLSTEAYICSYECTFCRSCTEKLRFICANCQGDLVRRPPRGRAMSDLT